MAKQSIVSKWECTAAMQEELIELHGSNKKKWHTEIANMIREHPQKFGILTVGTHDDGDNELTFDEFKEHFQGAIENEKLLRLIYDDIDHCDATHIKFVAIHRWLNEVKKQRKTEVVKDHKWLFEKLQPVQAAHLDEDGSGEVDRNEFTSYFVEKIGIDESLANAIFDDIDVNKDGDLSIMEYTRWKSKHNKASKLKKFFDAQAAQRASSVSPQPQPVVVEEAKCAQCEELKVEIKQLHEKVDRLSQQEQALQQGADALKKENAKLASGAKGNTAQEVQQSALQRENSKLKQENGKLLKEQQAMQQKSQKDETHTEKAKALQAQVDALKNENKKLSQRQQATSASSDEQTLALQAKVDALQSENKKLSQRQQATTTTSDEQTLALQAKVDALQNENEKLLQRQQLAGAANEEQTMALQTKVDALQSENKKLSQRQQAATTTSDEQTLALQTKVDALQNENVKLSQRQQAMSAASDEQRLALQKRIDALQAEKEQLSTERQSLRDESAMLRTSLEDERAKASTVIQASTAKSGKLEQEEARLRQVVSKLQSEQEQSRQQHETLKAEDKSKETQLIKVKQQIKELSVEVMELKDANTAQTGQVAKLKEKVSKYELESNAKDSEIGELRKKVSDNDEKAEIGLSQQKRLQKEIAELNENILSQNRKIKELKRELSRCQEQNDEYAVNLKTKGEEIALLKQSMASKSSNDAGKLKLLRNEIEVLTEDIERHQKEVKQVRQQMEEEQENADKISKEKRAVKAALSEKEGEIALLQHQLKLTQQNTDLAESTDNDQIRKLKVNNKALDDELMQQKIDMRTLKERYTELEQDLEREKHSIIQLKVQIDTERANTANAVRLKQTEADKHQNEVGELEDDKELLKKELASLKSLVETYKTEKEKLSTQKNELTDQQSALMQQMDAVNTSSVKSQETVQMQLEHYRKKCTTLEKEQESVQSQHKEEVARKATEIEQLVSSNAVLLKKMTTQKNNLDKVLREIVHNQAQQQQAEKTKVVRKTTKSKHDLSRLQIQIEILNSESFRTSSLFLICAYHKIEEDKFFGFLDFVQTDLNVKQLEKIFSTLKISDDLLPPLKVSAFLSVIVKLYMLRLQKMRNGKKQNKNENDRRVFEHFGCWIIRTHSKKLNNKQQSVTVLDDLNHSISAKYDVFEGVITKQQIADDFAMWCFDYAQSNGCHQDSKLK
mmetsp:Transcript_22861/g.36722  ORF Transcript_22861/g.36722 Transcript_22861/m.36722 type:complete len:1193 (+) Transcript_22861:40-3618(+)